MLLPCPPLISPFFFFNDTAPTEIYTLSLHDALPIFPGVGEKPEAAPPGEEPPAVRDASIGDLLDALRDVLKRIRPPRAHEDRKSTRLNSSHVEISYAVFCLKKKKKKSKTTDHMTLIQ